MPADSPTPTTPPPTTPNRWRRRASRLWWWMLPGMIATIVVALVCLEWSRRDPMAPRHEVKFPTSALTALGWSPAGRLPPEHVYPSEFMSGRTVTYCRPTSSFIEGLRAEVRVGRKDTPDEYIVGHGTIGGYGLPVPWLMQCEASASCMQPGNHSFFYDTPTHRFILGLIAVAEEGDIPALPARRVSPFVYKYLTFYPDPLGFLLNSILLSTLWMPITAWHRRRRANRTGCKRCGYSREGLAESAVCPECGLGAGTAGSEARTPE